MINIKFQLNQSTSIQMYKIQSLKSIDSKMRKIDEE